MKTTIAAIVLGVVLCAGAFATGQSETAAAPAVQRFSFSASNPGGTWYTMAGGLVQLLNDKLPETIRFDIVASGGSVENTRRLALGEADMTLSYSSHLWEGKTGVGILEGRPSNDLRILTELYASSHYFVTLKDKNIRTMQDLAGKRVILGSPGSGSSDNSRRSLAALGLKVAESELAFADAARSLQDGKADVLGMSGHPASGIVELAASKPIYVIPFSSADLDKIVEKTPFFSRGVMPANVYQGQTEEVPCFTFSVYLAAHADMPVDVVYQVMKVIFSPEGKAYLANVHPQFKTMKDNPEGVRQIGIPYHPGAEKFWKEQPK